MPMAPNFSNARFLNSLFSGSPVAAAIARPSNPQSSYEQWMQRLGQQGFGPMANQQSQQSPTTAPKKQQATYGSQYKGYTPDPQIAAARAAAQAAAQSEANQKQRENAYNQFQNPDYQQTPETQRFIRNALDKTSQIESVSDLMPSFTTDRSNAFQINNVGDIANPVIQQNVSEKDEERQRVQQNQERANGFLSAVRDNLAAQNADSPKGWEATANFFSGNRSNNSLTGREAATKQQQAQLVGRESKLTPGWVALGRFFAGDVDSGVQARDSSPAASLTTRQDLQKRRFEDAVSRALDTASPTDESHNKATASDIQAAQNRNAEEGMASSPIDAAVDAMNGSATDTTNPNFQQQFDIRDDNEFDIWNQYQQERADRLGETYNGYENMLDAQINAPREQWHDFVVDPRIIGQFADQLGYYVPADQQEYFNTNLVNYQANPEQDPVLRDLVEQGFNSMWDTQKAMDVDDMAVGVYDIPTYNRVFGPYASSELAQYSVDHKLYPALAAFDKDNKYAPYAYLDVGLDPISALEQLVNEGTDVWGEDNDTNYREGLYNNAMNYINQTLYGEGSGRTDLNPDKLSDEELRTFAEAVVNYELGTRNVLGHNMGDDLSSTQARNWRNKMFSLDPSAYYDEEFYNSSAGKDARAANKLRETPFGDNDFYTQNPYYGNTTYNGENSIGSYYTDPQAIAEYGIPFLGLNQAMAENGLHQGERFL